VNVTAVRVARPTATTGYFAPPLLDGESFADITPASVVAMEWTPGGTLQITFDGDLTAHEQHLVRIRCAARDATAEALMRDVLAAHEANEAFLGVAKPTPPRLWSQVQALTRQQQAVIALLVPVNGDT